MAATMHAILDRLAAVTAVKRTRGEDAERIVVNGGTKEDLRARQRAALATIDRAVADLEATL